MSLKADIRDPDAYWSMTIYGTRISNTLISLRHLYGPAEAMRWLTSPHPHLAGRMPADLLADEVGAREVRALIARINDGAYA